MRRRIIILHLRLKEIGRYLGCLWEEVRGRRGATFEGGPGEEGVLGLASDLAVGTEECLGYVNLFLNRIKTVLKTTIQYVLNVFLLLKRLSQQLFISCC